jgi:hypothetical protein
MGSRKQNERRFDSWVQLPGGGRTYRRDVSGTAGWKAVYFKEVDPAEITVRFCQEIYDDAGKLRSIHEKFPLDTGHRPV